MICIEYRVWCTEHGEDCVLGNPSGRPDWVASVKKMHDQHPDAGHRLKVQARRVIYESWEDTDAVERVGLAP